MPFDQSSVQRLVEAVQQWAVEEQMEGHHPPNPQQHQQMLGGTGGRDVNEQPTYPEKNAAGMLLLAPDGRALFVRRAANARDHAGSWSIPGGMTEGDELPWQTAQRETEEEVGDCGLGDCDTQLLDHSVADNGVGFTTFGGKVGDNFQPMLNEEHDGYQWARPDQPPQPLHPGLRSTLDFALDPLTEKGSKIMKSMKSQYGPEKGERVFYASKNKGSISGVDDSYVTTGRQDTQIPRPHPVNPHIDNPFNANVDAWASPAQPAAQVATTTPNSAVPVIPLARRRNNNDAGMGGPEARQHTKVQAAPGWMSVKAAHQGAHRTPDNPGRSPQSTRGPGAPHMHSSAKTEGMELDAWRSPSQADEAPVMATTTPTKALKPAASKPVAATAGSRQLTPNRYARGRDVKGGVTPPTQRGANDLARFVLRDTATDTEYALDQPLSADFQPLVATDDMVVDAGGGAGGWGHQGLVPPTQAGANDAPWSGGAGDPTVPAGEGGLPPPALPSGGRGGGMRGGTSMQMPAGPMNTGPKLTHSYKLAYPDGSVDERKITRNFGGAGMTAPEQDAWASPQQPVQQQPVQNVDRGWPTAGKLGPSPMGGMAGRRSGAGA